jgi:hypothetical protein
MGMNYYWHEKSPCPTCGHLVDGKHVGKSSAGWVFALHVYPEDEINDLEDWERLWSQGGLILDECGDEVSTDEMRQVITRRSWTKKDKPLMYESWDQFHRDNGSEEGPNGLARALPSSRMLKHGAGTWSCFIGEFS